MMNWLVAEIRRIGNTATWSWQGWLSAWQREKSLRQWVMVNVLSAGLAFALRPLAAKPAQVLRAQD